MKSYEQVQASRSAGQLARWKNRDQRKHASQKMKEVRAHASNWGTPKGQKRNLETRQKLAVMRKGKTYEEIFGKEKARELRETRRQARLGTHHSQEVKRKIGFGWRGKKNPRFSDWNRTHKVGVVPVCQLAGSRASAKNSKGKTFEQRYGVKKATQMKDQIRQSIKARMENGVPIGFQNPETLHKAMTSQKRVSKFEKQLLQALQAREQKCYPQVYIAGTRYCVDLLYPHLFLIIEIDGHYSHYADTGRIRLDKRRDRKLRSLGYHVYHLRRQKLNRGVTVCCNYIVGLANELVGG